MSLFNSVLHALYKKINHEQVSKDKIVEIISSILKTKITPDQITVKDGVLIVTAPATIKMALLLKKEALLKELKPNGIVKIN